jgi:hypothetical protein
VTGQHFTTLAARAVLAPASEEISRIDHAHQPGQHGKISEATAKRVLLSEEIADTTGLGHARGLDHDMLVARPPGLVGGRREFREGLGEFVLAGAAHAPVAQLHHIAARAGVGAGAHHGGVDVDRGDIVDHHGPAPAAGLGEQMIEQRGLARPEETAKHGHEGKPGRGRRRDVHLPAPFRRPVWAGPCDTDGTDRRSSRLAAGSGRGGMWTP